jgi:tRNA(Ile)-lysidine synthase TilS/MesJ
LCQFCENFTPLTKEKAGEYRVQMDTLFRSPPAGGKYDVIFALSGGMDSSYMLYRLKKDYPGLNILAVQFDNSFISDTARENARKFCTMTHSTYKRLVLDQDELRDTFRKAAVSTNAYPGFAKYRASDICNTCISIIKQKIIETAVITKSPLIVFAFSPGQTDTPVITLTRPFMAWIRKIFEGQLKEMGVVKRDSYLIDEKNLRPDSAEPGIMIIHPYLIWGYNKRKIREECIKLGWIEPELHDRNSSNCLLNAFAIQNHQKKYGIHSYAFDLAALVRQGYMEREEALNKLKDPLTESSVEEVQRALNL